jgi:hypothetical protein
VAQWINMDEILFMGDKILKQWPLKLELDNVPRGTS